MTILNDYRHRFTHLGVNKNAKQWTAVTTHRAPHKPILLLAVLDLFAQGSIKSNFIELTTELIELFGLYWHKVRPSSRRGYITYPFYYLQSEGFWHLLPQAGQEAPLAVYRPNAGLASLQNLILGARLDDDLYELLGVEHSRSRLRAVLITTYFAPELHQLLLEQSSINAEAYQYSQELLEQARSQTVKESLPPAGAYRTAVRDQGFRRVIVKAYDHRCAICGLRILTADGYTAVAAAHIVPWSHSHNDDPRNGLALCHLCHWTFDKGLVSFSDQYQVKTSPQLASQPNLPGHLLTMSGRLLIGPADDALWPYVDSIRWHRREVFHGR
jgi:putative restriction endonuclease